MKIVAAKHGRFDLAFRACLDHYQGPQAKAIYEDGNIS